MSNPSRIYFSLVSYLLAWEAKLGFPFCVGNLPMLDYLSQWSIVGWVLRPGEWVYPIVLFSILSHSFMNRFLHILVPRDRHPFGEFKIFCWSPFTSMFTTVYVCMFSRVYDYCFTWFPTHIFVGTCKKYILEILFWNKWVWEKLVESVYILEPVEQHGGIWYGLVLVRKAAIFWCMKYLALCRFMDWIVVFINVGFNELIVLIFINVFMNFRKYRFRGVRPCY